MPAVHGVDERSRLTALMAAVGESDGRSRRELELICEDGSDRLHTDDITAGSATNVTTQLGGPRLASPD